MIRMPNWSQILRSDFGCYENFKEFYEIVKRLNYPYFIWNNQLYMRLPLERNIKVDYIRIEGNKIYVEEPEGEF